MKINKIKLEILYLSLAYFLLLGFGVLFVVNLTLRSLVWPFFQNTIIISSVNLLFSIFILWSAIKIASPFFKLKLKNNNKHFLIISSLLMFFAILVTNFYLYFSLTATAMIVQAVNSLILLASFSFFSYNYIVKDKV
jgi:hypothetical protein